MREGNVLRTIYEIANVRISVEAPFELIDNGAYSLYRMNFVDLTDERNAFQGNSDIVPMSEDRYDTATLGTCNVKAIESDSIINRYEIHLVEDSDIPQLNGRILFRNEMNLYIESEGKIIHFFRKPFERRIAAWSEATNSRSLEIHYQQEVRDYFRGSIGCFNASSFENIMYIFRKYLFHCSYVDIGGEAVLFSAHSGGGKTTHALLWEHNGFGEMINGDRAAIEKMEDTSIGLNRKYIVHGLPIAGSSDVFKNRTLPLRAIFMLEKAPVNEVVDISPSKQFLSVFEQITMHSWDREFVSVVSDFVAELIQNVPVKLLRCRPDEGAVKAVIESLKA